MAKQSWSPTAIFARAIGRLEEANGGELEDWTSREARAAIRFVAEEACADAQEPLSDGQKKAIREAVIACGGCLTETANTKKRLQEFGSVPKVTPASTDEY